VSNDLLYAAVVARANQASAPGRGLRTECWRVKGGMGYDGSAPAVDCQPCSERRALQMQAAPNGRAGFLGAARVNRAELTRSPERQPSRPSEVITWPRIGSSRHSLTGDVAASNEPQSHAVQRWS
jgi:hypothetical protein